MMNLTSEPREARAMDTRNWTNRPLWPRPTVISNPSPRFMVISLIINLCSSPPCVFRIRGPPTRSLQHSCTHGQKYYGNGETQLYRLWMKWRGYRRFLARVENILHREKRQKIVENNYSLSPGCPLFWHMDVKIFLSAEIFHSTPARGGKMSRLLRL